MGRRGVRRRGRRGQAVVRLHRLLHLPLVPRHGAPVVRGRGHRRGHERAFRERQDRPRGTARRGPHLHERRAGGDRLGRLADVGVPHAAAASVLRRHLLSAALGLRAARISGVAVVPGPPLAGAARRGGSDRRPHHRRGAAGGGSRVRRADRSAGGAGRPRSPGRGDRRAGVLLRCRVRRLRRRPEVSAPGGVHRAVPTVPAHRERTAAGDGAGDAPADGARRHARSFGRRVPSLQRGPLLARPPLREDALRSGAARQRLHRRLPAHRGRPLRGGRGCHPRLPAARSAGAGGRFLFRRGRRLGPRPAAPGGEGRGGVLPVDHRPGARRVPGGGRRRSGRVDRRLWSDCRGQHHLRPARRVRPRQRVVPRARRRSAAAALAGGPGRGPRPARAAAAGRQDHHRLERSGDCGAGRRREGPATGRLRCRGGARRLLRAPGAAAGRTAAAPVPRRGGAPCRRSGRLRLPDRRSAGAVPEHRPSVAAGAGRPARRCHPGAVHCP